MNGRIRWRRSSRWVSVLVLLFGWSLTATAQSSIDRLQSLAAPNLLSNGDFEVDKPAYWEATGDGAEWSMEESRTPNFSLKLTGAGEAMWMEDEAIRNWNSQIAGNEEFVVGGWFKTVDVNTAPASDAEKFQLGFEFYNADGTDLLGGPLVIDVPQDVATSDGWLEVDNTSQGALSLPEAATSVKIWFKKGAGATGTVYFDDLFIRGAGGFHNTNFDAGDTWYYWWSGSGSGDAGWPASQPFFQTVTDEDVHSGNYALMIEQNDPDASETVAISERVPVTPGEPVLVSYWVKTEGVMHPDSIGTADYNIGMTALWYENMTAGADGYGEIGGLDIRLNGEYNPNVIPLVPREESTGWTQYAFVVYPADGAVGMEIRLRYWHHFEGTTYWDDVYITSLGGDALSPVGTPVEEDDVAELPSKLYLQQNYPNPFNPATTIAFELPSRSDVTLEVFSVLGRRVATLLNGQPVEPGRHEVRFDASDLPSGTYLYVLRTDRHTEARSMVLLK